MTKLLSGHKPVFLLHQSFRQRRRLPEAMAKMMGQLGNAIELGVIARMPRYSPLSVASFLQSFSCDLKLADPEVYLHPGNYGGAKSPAVHYDYLQNDLPTGTDAKWIEQVLSYQVAAGATVLLSPSLLLPAVNPPRELAEQFEWMRVSRDLSNGKPLMGNLTLKHSWLTDQPLRTMLLNELVDSDVDKIYLRVLWPNLTPRYGQLMSAEILSGYRAIVNVLAAEGRTLILPTTALTGWLFTALGASGFSMGPSRDQQAFVVDPIIKRQPGTPAPPQRNRYFESRLLHVVDLETHDTLLQSDGYCNCTCNYCDQLSITDAARTAWDPEAASLHYLQSAAELSSNIAHRNARAVALRTVREARTFLSSLSAPVRPLGENYPRHLVVWEELLS